MRKYWWVLIVFVTSLSFYLPYNSYLAITDPVESNYALTAKEMVLSGDWLSPQIYGKYWFDKPIMIYWLIAGCYKIFGINEFAARFPAAIFSAASVALAYWFSMKLFEDRRAAMLSAILLATSLEFWVLARMVITDAVLFFFFTFSLVALYRGIIEKNTGWMRSAYAFAGLAVLTKGPVGLVLPGIIVFVYILGTRQWHLFKRLYVIQGLIVFCLIAAPWYILMAQNHGRDFIDTFLGLHNYMRATVSEHPKDNVFYYYLVLFPVSLMPWTGIVIKAIFRAFTVEKQQAQVAFLVNWLMVIIVFYSLMATKYPTYVFPATFPAILLAGRYLAFMESQAVPTRWLWLTIPTGALIVSSVLGTQYLPVVSEWRWLYIYAIISVSVMLFLQIRGRFNRLPEVVALSTVILALIIIQNALVPLSLLRSAKVIARDIPSADATVGCYGDYATSAVFYSGHYIPKLVHSTEERPTGAWRGKYTMPMELITAFDSRASRSRQAFIIVNDNRAGNFTKESIASKYMRISQNNKMELYKRIAE